MLLILQLLSTAQAVTKAGQRLFKPHRLTVAHFNVLNLLSDQADGMRASDLARALIVDPSNVTGLLKRMKAEGYLKALDHPADRRHHVVVLTAKGRNVWQKAFRDYQRALEAFEADLRPEERTVADSVLQRIHQSCQDRP
jgi:DNA-binding MarR family transcriptional regulator